ncbi:MAG: DUF4062 domain-containing protein [Syntrophaceae bacterium]|nr:DUF4062 domain-containing protein [Syntrophaceae bacterium]
MKYKIFVSGVQKEFKNERLALRDYIHGDPLLGQFFEVFLFELQPANDCRAYDLYLEEVKVSDIYLGLFGDNYGPEDSKGQSPTHKEFLLATELGKIRFIYIKGQDDSKRHPKMLDLIRSAGEQLIRRRFNTQPELYAAVYASLVNHLISAGKIVTGPFDASACRNATMDDISSERIKWFLTRARSARKYTLADTTPTTDALKHLNLLDNNKPSHAAILLFGNNPQRFMISSEVKCMHFHTLEKRKPIPSYQIYKGTLFDLVDQAVDFVMSKLSRLVGTRAKGPQAPVEYDIPEEVVAEGIVNAVAHRDYTSNASVEVQVFPDRLEIWNPGTIHPPLTLKKLLLPHASQPNNPLIAEPLFLTKYIEKAGSGTVDMINRCQKSGMRKPEFKIDGGFFVLKVWRKRVKRSEAKADRSRNHVRTKLGLSQDQVDILRKCKQESKISELMKISSRKNRTKFRDQVLNVLINAGLLEMTIPDKPRSSKQKYRITKKGSEYLKKQS